MIPSLESLDWSRFLARPCLPTPAPAALDTLCREPVLITGAGGSIGSALDLRSPSHAPVRLLLLEASESHMFALQRESAAFGAESTPGFSLGSIGNSELLDEIFFLTSPCLVLHNAAFKHMPLLEEQPLTDLLRDSLAQLRWALDALDLPAALARLQTLVPDYIPSSAVMTLVKQSAARVSR